MAHREDVAVAEGDGVAVAEGDGVAVAEGDGVAVAEGDGVAVAEGDGVAVAEGDRVAVADDEGVAVALGIAVGVAPVPVSVIAGRPEHPGHDAARAAPTVVWKDVGDPGPATTVSASDPASEYPKTSVPSAERAPDRLTW